MLICDNENRTLLNIFPQKRMTIRVNWEKKSIDTHQLRKNTSKCDEAEWWVEGNK